MDAIRQGTRRQRWTSATAVATLGLYSTIWTLLSPIGIVHAAVPLASYATHGQANCAFMSSCAVMDILMQEINALKEKMAQIAHFQSGVDRFKFQYGIYRSEMDKFRQNVELFMKAHHSQFQPADGRNHDNEVVDTTHADDPNHNLHQNDSMPLLTVIHTRLEKVETIVRQWEEKALITMKNQEAIRKKLEQEEGTRKVLEDKIGHLQKKTDEIQTLIDDGKDDVKTMKNELWDLKQANNKHEIALDRQQDAVQKMNRTLSTRVGELDNSIGYINSTLFPLSFRLTEFQDNITRDLEVVKKATNSKLSNVTTHLEKMVSQLSNFSFYIQNGSSAVSAIASELAEVQAQVKLVKDQTPKFDMLFAKHNNELQSFLKTVRDINTTMWHNQHTLDSVAEDVESLKLDFINWKEALIVFNDSVISKQEIVSLQQICNRNLTDLKISLNATEHAIEDLRTSSLVDMKSQKERINELHNRMVIVESFQTNLANEVKAYEFQAGNCKRDIDNLNQQNMAKSTNLKALNYNVKTIQNSLDSLQKHQTELKANLTEMMQLLLPLLPTSPPLFDRNATTVETATTSGTTSEENVMISEIHDIAEPLTKLDNKTSCSFEPLSHANIVASIRGRPIRNMEMVAVTEGDEIEHRCKDIGLFRMEGNVQRTCLKNGTWTGIQPFCHKLVTMGDFTGKVPMNASIDPVIEIDPAPDSPSTGLSANGSLIVVPGSRVAFVCIYPQVLGAVHWTFTPPRGSTTQVLTSSLSKEFRSETKIQNARTNQSGQYTCKNSKGVSHTINVVVKEVNCSSPPDDPGLQVLTLGKLRMNSLLKFGCNDFGHVLSFPEAKNSTLTLDDVDEANNDDFRCLASGEWSRDFPVCVRKYRRGR